MEAEPERRRLRVRKPLSDCTNTIANTKTSTNTNATATSSQSSSASTATLKRLNPKLSSATKTLVAALNPKPSAPPPPIPSTPSRPPPISTSSSGTSDCDGFEACSVYTRRQTALKRKSKDKENTVPFNCPPAPKIRNILGKLKEDGHNSLSKESTAPRKKKQCAVPAGKDVSMHALPQDFIEKQRAYFAEIDAFELPEEEVDSVD
ncbi:unnamed protein product [Prunus armeniaca]|uniref:Sororin C-terminal region domain-containing protein n=1 Tax=Prunus armeniaca TaxID=36596 RepID=A0A6J5WMD1_PRUAR|nr:unnamed protein product [Prunus armeniaca]